MCLGIALLKRILFSIKLYGTIWKQVPLFHFRNFSSIVPLIISSPVLFLFYLCGIHVNCTLDLLNLFFLFKFSLLSVFRLFYFPHSLDFFFFKLAIEFKVPKSLISRLILFNGSLFCSSNSMEQIEFRRKIREAKKELNFISTVSKKQYNQP